MGKITKEQEKWLSTFVDKIFTNERDSYNYFVEYYCALYNAYLKELEIILPKSSSSKIWKDVNNVYGKVLEYIKDSLTGDVVRIHQSMAQWWFTNHISKSHIESICKGDFMYRIRTKVNGETFTSANMGYVPFTKRHILKNYRYSISGTPCLYAGRSILGCWEEMRRPSLDCIYVSKVTFNKDVKLLDLRLFREIEEEKDFIDYVVLFPLILACSIKVSLEDDNNRFKPEYIIPQLLMQSIMKKDKEGEYYYHGIIYNSTQMDANNPYKDRTLYENVAIPIKSKIRNGKEIDLMSTDFSFSKPLNIEYARLTNLIKEPLDSTYVKSIWGQTEALLH